MHGNGASVRQPRHHVCHISVEVGSKREPGRNQREFGGEVETDGFFEVDPGRTYSTLPPFARQADVEGYVDGDAPACRVE